MAPFQLSFHARGYELDHRGNLHHAVYLQWFQEAATGASKAAGFGVEDYVALGTAWVVRELDVEFLAAAGYRDEVVVSTWVSDFRRVRSHREYVARRARDDALLARARVDWVYLDRATGAPRRVLPDMSARFEPFGEPALDDFPSLKSSDDGAPVFESPRRVQHFEIDEMQIVNHPQYVTWLEQNMRDAIRARGGDATRLDFSRHFVEFLQPAREGDIVAVCSQASEEGGAHYWAHQIKRGDSVLIKARTLGAITSKFP